MLQQLRDYLLSSWVGLGLGNRIPNKLDFYLSSKSKKIRIWVFLDDNPQPCLLIKTTRFRYDAELIEQEAARVRQLTERYGALADTIPPLLRMFPVDGRQCIAYRYLACRRLHVSRRRFPGQYRLITGYLARLGRATREVFDPLNQDHTQLLEFVKLEREYFVRRCSYLSVPERLLLESIFDGNRFRVDLTSTVLTHGDFGANNILLCGRRPVRIVPTDFEFSIAPGLPFYDLAFFAIHYWQTFLLEGLQEFANDLDPTGIINGLFGCRGAYSSLVLEMARTYSNTIGINSPFFPIVALFVMIRTWNLCDRAMWFESPGRDWGRLAQYFLRLWNSEQIFFDLPTGAPRYQ